MTLRVLLVEDNELVTSAMRVLIEAGGHEVHTAATVAEAVRVCGEARPDLLLLDLTLPDGSGLDALRGMQDGGFAPRIAVALTGHDDGATQARCAAAGCRATLLKPVPVRDLLRQLDTWSDELCG